MVTSPTEFLNAIFQDIGEDEYVCVSQQINRDGDTFFLNRTTGDEGFQRWCRRPERAVGAWYYSLCSVDGEVKPNGMVKRGRANLKRYYAIVLDDIGTKVEELPPVAPSYKIETSPGNYQWGYLLVPGTDMEKYEALVLWLLEQGWGDAGAGGAYRIMRVPGSANIKEGRDNFRSRIEYWDGDIDWTLDELAEEFGCTPQMLSEVKKKMPSVKVSGAVAADIDAGFVDPVLVWLNDGGLVRADNGNWVDVLCPWADQHTTGGDTAGYSPLGRGDDGYRETRGFKCLHEHCRSRRIGDFSDWITERGGPVALGRDPLPLIQSRYVFVRSGSKVVDLEARAGGREAVVDLNDFGNAHYTKVRVPWAERPILLKTAYLESGDTIKAENVGYYPTLEDTPLIDVGGGRMANLYIPPTWPETDEEPELLLEHLRYLLPKREEYECFVRWLAFKVQNPAQRSYAVVMVAENAFGIGRSLLRGFLGKMMPQNVKPGTLGQLIGKGSQADANYNDWGSNAQFLIVEEAKGTVDPKDFYDGFEKFKEIVDITPVEMRINPKFGRTRVDLLYFNALILTNHVDSMPIPYEEDERRLAVFTNPTERRDKEYYDALFDELRDPDGQEHVRLYWYLRRLDLNGFDHVYPPMTAAKGRMMNAALSPNEEVEEHMMSAWLKDFVTRETLTKALYQSVKACGYSQSITGRSFEIMVGRVWKRLQDVPGNDNRNGFRPRIEGVQTRVKMLRPAALSDIDWTEDLDWKVMVGLE